MSGEQLKNIFSKNLRFLLSEREKTQADLSRMLKVSTATASDWCNGKGIPRTDKLQRIADWLNVDASYLLKDHCDDDEYYLDPETAQIAQEVYDNPELQILFKASRDLGADDIRFVVDMIERMKGGKK